MQTLAARTDVRQTQPEILDLALDTYIELVNSAVVDVERISRDTLRRDGAGDRWERIGKRKQRLAI